MKDDVCVWLSLHSGVGLSGSEIERVIGMQSNVPTSNSLGFIRPGKSFQLMSDIEVAVSKPLLDHLNWLGEKCAPHMAGLGAFVADPENRGEVFIFGQTYKDAIYFELQSSEIRDFIDLGFTLLVNAEIYHAD